MTITLIVDGQPVELDDADELSLLEVLRERLGLRSAKDGCSPQGQCGCCTVLVDGAARVACVTPARRVSGRTVTTIDGLEPDVASGWAESLCASGGSQCGFCTPGIVMRLEALRTKGALGDRPSLDKALAAHLCRCTGWQTIREAAVGLGGADPGPRDLAAASRRATIEGRSPQQVAPEVALGRGGFADDLAPDDALVALPDATGGWAVADTLHEARVLAAKVQGRRSTAAPRHPLEVPPGDWSVTLRTTWIEPAYLEPDASWCEPGVEPVTSLANGGAFGGKASQDVARAARQLADLHQRPVRVLLPREEVVRRGPKRPPIAAGVRPDGSGLVRVVDTPGAVELLAVFAPTLEVEAVSVPGPSTSLDLRGALWAEVAALQAVARGDTVVVAPDGGRAEVEIAGDGRVRVLVRCGAALDEVVVRSYCIGAVHMGFGMVDSERLTVDEDGTVHDLTIRSFGVLRSADMPEVDVEIEASADEPVNGSDAVFASAAAALWAHQGLPPEWPTGLGVPR